jgi:hypothetical protein
MHGTASRKVPGGKLLRVAVEFDETYRAVQLTGDFFLEPPEALESLTAAVEGHPITASREDLVDAIAAVDAELIGFDAEDLAVAVRAAVGQIDDADDPTPEAGR